MTVMMMVMSLMMTSLFTLLKIMDARQRVGFFTKNITDGSRRLYMLFLMEGSC